MLRLHFGDPGQYKLRIISMQEQHFRSDFARGRLADRTNRTVRRAASCRRSAATLSCSWPALLSTLVGDGNACRLQRRTSGHRGSDAGSRATNRGGAATEARTYTGFVRARYEGVGGLCAALRWDIQPRDRGDSTNEQNEDQLVLFGFLSRNYRPWAAVCPS